MNENNVKKENRIYVLIPSLNPNDNFVDFVDSLMQSGLKNVVVVDDGSDFDKKDIFNQLARHGAIVINHDSNKGKGAALKTGFKFVYENDVNAVGIVTMDSDGQHSIQDAGKIAAALMDNNDSIVIGTRDFNKNNVPKKSKVGNRITSRVFRLLYHRTVSDTQTGLRGIPLSIIPLLLQIRGNRFEYETAMLLDAFDKDIPIVEVPIETIYLRENKETHFNPFTDSIKIYLIIFKYFILYSCSGLLSFFIDIMVYAILTKLAFKNLRPEYCILWGTIGGRVVSSVFNFTVNKIKVFNPTNGLGNSLVRYYLLCLCRVLVSSGTVALLYFATKWDTTIIKTIIDFILFLLCFKLQKQWVFKKNKSKTDIWVYLILILLCVAFVPMYIGDVWDKLANCFWR